MDDHIELLKDEQGGLMMEEGIATISFFQGDFNKASDALRSQFALVISSNPWLAGKLEKTKEGKIQLRSGSVDDISNLFIATDDVGFEISPRIPYVTMCTNMYKSGSLVVGNGYAILDKDKPVTLLTVVKSSANEFAVIFSMSHVIGDGRTFYEIFNMLRPGSQVRALTSKRVMEFSESMRDAYGRKEFEWADSMSTQILYTVSMMFNSAPKCFAFHLDEAKISKAKVKAARDGGVDFVSTNDIITSGFFNACDARIGFMGFDCRDKGLDGVGNDLAGNYVTALVIGPEVFATAGTMREMYTPGKPYVTTKMPLPGCCCGKGRFAMVTNWSSFAQELIAIDDCEMVIHLPVQNPSYCTYDLMIPFATGSGGRGVICWTVSTDEEGLRNALPLGTSVSDELFPLKQN